METLIKDNGTVNKVMKKVAETLPKQETLTKAMEKVTSLSTGTFLWTSVSVVGLAFLLKMFGKNDAATFIAQLVSPVLVLGLYNKLVNNKLVKGKIKLDHEN